MRKLIVLFLGIVLIAAVFFLVKNFSNKKITIIPTPIDTPKYLTDIETYVPPAPIKTIKGSCGGSSLASPLNDNAYRCVTGHFIHDPCFGTPSSKVVCDSYPDDTKNAFTLDLESPLPERSTESGGWRFYSKDSPNNDNDFWILELENGYKCYAYTGTLPFINGETFYYYCMGKGEEVYASQVQSTIPYFTTTLVSQKYNFEENVDASKFQVQNILRIWK